MPEVVRICLEQFLVLAISAQGLFRRHRGRQEALPALSNQNDEEAARDEKGSEIFILSLASDTPAGKRRSLRSVLTSVSSTNAESATRTLRHDLRAHALGWGG